MEAIVFQIISYKSKDYEITEVSRQIFLNFYLKNNLLGIKHCIEYWTSLNINIKYVYVTYTGLNSLVNVT